MGQISAMKILSDNLRYLRDLKKLSQQDLADHLNISRTALSKYEIEKSEPPLYVMQRISAFFFISIDILISVDLSKTDIQKLLKMEDNRILLPILVDKTGKDFIEIIPHKTIAGYLTGYSDPEFIEQLQSFSLPMLRSGKYRAFAIEGDSMPPHESGSFIIGRYVEKLVNITDGKTYVVLTQNDGIVYKRLSRKDDNTFSFQSDNELYKPYEVNANEIIEVWEFASSIATKEADADLSKQSTKNILVKIRTQISSIIDK